MTQRDEVIKFLALFFLNEFREDAAAIAEYIVACGYDVDSTVRIAKELSAWPAGEARIHNLTRRLQC